jgi:hypothetical protein
MESKLFTLLKSQWLKGLYTTVGGAVLDTVYQIIASKGSINIKELITVATIAGLSYIKITFLSNSDRKLFVPEQTK